MGIEPPYTVVWPGDTNRSCGYIRLSLFGGPSDRLRMRTVRTVSGFDASVLGLRGVLANVELLLDAAGFETRRDGVQLRLSGWSAVDGRTLTIEIVRDDEAVLAYRHVAGPFEAMHTRYLVDRRGGRARLGIETAFEPPSDGPGSLVGEEAIDRRHHRELDAVGSLLDAASSPRIRGTDGRVAGRGGD